MSVDLITYWAFVLECGMMPSPGTTALTGQPKAVTAEDKLQGKRQVARRKEKCEQREGDEVMGMCRQRKEGVAAKAASREGVTFHDLHIPNNMECPIPQPWHPHGSRHLEMKVWRQRCAPPFLEDDLAFISLWGALWCG